MAILASQKPDKVLMLEAGSRFGKPEFRPLEPGLGITVGNALRRILLSLLEGFAITTIRIDGVEHELSSVSGVKEDVTSIILNLKQTRFKQIVEEFENERVNTTVENSGKFKVGDIGKYLTGSEVLNPELVIRHLDSKSTMQIDITINKGRGYVSVDENREHCTDVNVISIDSIYTPICGVKYAAENFRVEQKTDYEKLVLGIGTDGPAHPREALKEAAKILIYHFMLFSGGEITLESNDTDGNEEFDEEVLYMCQLLKVKLVDMDLSVRAPNCLKVADVETPGNLVQSNKTGLLRFGNFGKKSLTELDDLLESLNPSFGIDISKYELDKEQKMRHNKKFNHLGRIASYRSAMLSNMTCSLIKHKRTTMTVVKVKALKKFVEPLIIKSKEDTTNSRRIVLSDLQDKIAVTELFKEVSVKIVDRPGGYTRIIKTDNHLGDNAKMCFIKLVDYNENMAKEKVAKKATRTCRSEKAIGAALAVVEVPATEAPKAEEPKAESAE